MFFESEKSFYFFIKNLIKKIKAGFLCDACVYIEVTFYYFEYVSL
jgi:hypothetical protein